MERSKQMANGNGEGQRSRIVIDQLGSDASPLWLAYVHGEDSTIGYGDGPTPMKALERLLGFAQHVLDHQVDPTLSLKAQRTLAGRLLNVKEPPRGSLESTSRSAKPPQGTSVAPPASAPQVALRAEDLMDPPPGGSQPPPNGAAASH